jgi:MoxR-like ATPase
VVAADVRDLAADVLRHRLVLSYDALAEGVTADDILARVIEAIPLPAGERRRTDTAQGDRFAA